jgi:hypothetical protein
MQNYRALKNYPLNNMDARLWVKEILINDESRVSFESNDIIVIVGPNNSGKSTIISEISNGANDINWMINAKIIKGLNIGNSGSVDDLKKLLQESSFKQTKSGDQTSYHGYRWNLMDYVAKARWDNINLNGLLELSPLFIKHVSSDGRLGIANQVQSYDALSESPNNPIQFLYKSEQHEKKFSEAFEKAFGSELIVNKGGGQFIHLHVGRRPPMDRDEDRVSESYLRKLRAIPTIQDQGDGMRSFLGLLLEVLLGNQSVTLIDEPEVFLHPPQARLLGRMLATDVPSDKQIFISTHSEDFLKGLLDSNSSRVKVLRINRENEINHVRELTKDQIKESWNDPLLRHSNVLSGLFHSNVVLCEGDMDCRFYSSILDSVLELDHERKKSEKLFRTLPDPLFIHCGGKHRMPMVVKSLIKLAVPITVVCDFDLLNKIDPLKKIFEELGGDWKTIESDWKIVKSHVDSKKPELETKDVKDKIGKILEKETTTVFSSNSVEEIRELLRKTSSWSIAKSVGKSFIPSGDATNAYNRLINKLEDKRLFIVEVGEVEHFDKSIGNHGPKWVNDVLLKDIKSAPELEDARKFVLGLFGTTELPIFQSAIARSE